MLKSLVAALLLCATLMLLSQAVEGDVIRSRCREGDDWYFFNGNCYFWSSKSTEGWFGAEKHCQDMGGHLVNIGSQSENNFVHAMAQCVNEFWIGMVKTDVRQRGFVWWQTRKPSNYTEMLNIRSGDFLDCVHFDSHNNGRWYNTYCQQTRNYVCTTPTTSDELAKYDPPAGSPENSKCPNGWLSIENNCYFVSSERTNYFNAQLSCEAKGATVASVVSAREQVLVTMALGCGTEAWIGLEKARPCFTNPSQQTCWVWMDGSPHVFTAWYDGFPSTAKEVECAVTNGRWKSANCYSEYRYICKKKLI